MIQQLILPFAFYAFLGWVLETLYATQKQHHFVNRGFLHGPFCPIYGIGGLLVEQAFINMEKWTNGPVQTILGGIVLSILLVTILEYATGSVLENIFQKKWWDYSNEAFNLKGYICLRFSLFWGMAAYVVMQIIQPIRLQLAGLIPLDRKETLAALLMAYFLVDLMKTISDLVDLRRVVLRHAEYSMEAYRNKIIEHKRFFHAFPSLRQLNAHVKNREIRRIFDEKINSLKTEIKNRLSL